MGSCCGCWKQELWQTGSLILCYLFVNVYFCSVVSCVQNLSWTGWNLVCSKVYEKLISGMYLGELFRQVVFSKNSGTWNLLSILFQVLLEAVDKHLLFPGVDVMRTLGERDCLQTRHISAIESDGPGEYSATWEVLRELGLEKLATASDCRVIRWDKNNVQHRKQKVWQNIVFKRSKLLLTDTSPSALGSERPRLRRRELRVCSTRWTGGGTWRRAFCSKETFIDFE